MKKIMIKSSLYFLMVGMMVNVHGSDQESFNDAPNGRGNFSGRPLGSDGYNLRAGNNVLLDKKSVDDEFGGESHSSASAYVNPSPIEQASRDIEDAFISMDNLIKNNIFSRTKDAVGKIDEIFASLGKKTGFSSQAMQPLRNAIGTAISAFSEKSSAGDMYLKSEVLAHVVNSVKFVLVTPVKLAINLGALYTGEVIGAAGGAVVGLGSGVYRTAGDFNTISLKSFNDAALLLPRVVVKSLQGVVTTAKLTAYGAFAGLGIGAYVASDTVHDNVTGDVFKLSTKNIEAQKAADREDENVLKRFNKSYLKPVGVSLTLDEMRQSLEDKNIDNPKIESQTTTVDPLPANNNKLARLEAFYKNPNSKLNQIIQQKLEALPKDASQKEIRLSNGSSDDADFDELGINHNLYKDSSTKLPVRAGALAGGAGDGLQAMQSRTPKTSSKRTASNSRIHYNEGF